MPSPNVEAGGTNDLRAVSVRATNDAWAAGLSRKVSSPGDVSHTLLLHWDGKAWGVVPSPNVGNGSNQLDGVVATARNDAWAVGSYTGDGLEQMLALHWDGKSWRAVSLPGVGQVSSHLTSVTALSASDVWAVGSLGDEVSALPSRTVILHWDGHAWTVVPGPNPSVYGNQLNSVSAASSRDIWAVGSYVVRSDDPVPGVSSPEPYSLQPLFLHWDGAKWNQVAAPSNYSDFSQFIGVAVAPGVGNAAWAVGATGVEGSVESRALHWDGRSWTTATLSLPPVLAGGLPENSLSAVVALSPNDVWTVGLDGSGAGGRVRTLTMHWNGAAWTLVSSPSPDVEVNTPTGKYRVNANYLKGVAALSPGNVWAVGTTEGYGSRTLIMHYTGARCPASTPKQTSGAPQPPHATPPQATHPATPTGTPTRSPAPRGCGLDWTTYPLQFPDLAQPSELRGVAAVSANDVWAVGYAGGQPLILHWNGSSWLRSSVPTVSGATGSILQGVTAISRDDVWAVGSLYTGAATDLRRTLTMHWDGRIWSIVSSPNSNGARYSYLLSGAGSSGDVWAVGYQSDGGARRTLAMHWDGHAWSLATTPNVGALDNVLQAVAARSPGDVWAVGSYNVPGDPGSNGPDMYNPNRADLLRPLSLHWDGRGWSVVETSPVNGVGLPAGSLNRVIALPDVQVWASGPGLLARWDGTKWHQELEPSTGPGLYGVVAVGGEIQVVGKLYGNSTPDDMSRARLRDGAVVKVVPPVAGAGPPQIASLAAITGGDIWAVGNIGGQAHIEHYGGTLCPTATSTPSDTPLPTATPLPGGPAPAPVCGTWNVTTDAALGLPANQGAGLAAIAITDQNDIWAVGSYASTLEKGNRSEPTILHWNGNTWSPRPVPLPDRARGAVLLAVSALSRSDVWAVGSYEGYYENQGLQSLALHWNGTQWSIVPTPNGPDGALGRLAGVAAISPNDVWAVGSYAYETKPGNALLLHWDGKSWTQVQVQSPSPGDGLTNLAAVAAVSTNDVWAVGSYSVRGMAKTLVTHWNGTTWTVVGSADPGPESNSLRAVAALSSNDVWAVGVSQNKSVSSTLIEHWDGVQWSAVPSPNVSATFNDLYSVAPARGGGGVWAVGQSGATGEGKGAALVEHWDGAQWSVAPSPPLGDGGVLLGVSTLPDGAVLAVGRMGDVTGNGKGAMLLAVVAQLSQAPCAGVLLDATISRAAPSGLLVWLGGCVSLLSQLFLALTPPGA